MFLVSLLPCLLVDAAWSQVDTAPPPDAPRDLAALTSPELATRCVTEIKAGREALPIEIIHLLRDRGEEAIESMFLILYAMESSWGHHPASVYEEWLLALQSMGPAATAAVAEAALESEFFPYHFARDYKPSYPGAVDDHVPLLGDPTEYVRIYAAWILAQSGEQGLSAVVELLRSVDPGLASPGRGRPTTSVNPRTR